MRSLAAVDFGQGVEDAWAKVAKFIPQFLGFLVVLLVGYVIAKAIAKALNGVLERVGFDNWVERGGIRKALAASKYDASDITAKVIFYALFLLVLQLAFGIFGPNPVSRLIEGVIAYLPKVFAAIVVVVVAAAIAAAVKDLIGNALSGLSYGRTLANITSIAIIATGVFMALNQLKIAPAIVNGLFYAVLAVIAGSAIIAIGGGGIQPMRQRWERSLQRWDDERPKMQRELDRQRSQSQNGSDGRQPVTGAATVEGVTSTRADATASTMPRVDR